MPKKFVMISLALVGLLFLSGCGKKTGQNNLPAESNTKNNAEKTTASDTEATSQGNSTVDNGQSATNPALLTTCQEGNVSLPNYGDPGHRLKNCFVQYPGEPSRRDKSYYIVEDICGQFTKEFMENMYGAKLSRIELPKVSTINNCTYYFDEKEYVMLNLEYLSAENQKKGNEAMDRKVEKDSQIPMDNMVTYQEDGIINVIYLVLGPEKFISLRPSSKNAITKEKFLELAANIGSAIRGYK
jgi:hypothetical protein